MKKKGKKRKKRKKGGKDGERKFLTNPNPKPPPPPIIITVQFNNFFTHKVHENANKKTDQKQKFKKTPPRTP